MRYGKTHFITGAVVGATVNFIIQSAKMAMDYDKPFDWHKFFLCTGAAAFAGIGPRRCAALGTSRRNGLPRETAEPSTSSPRTRDQPKSSPILPQPRFRRLHGLRHFRQSHPKILPHNPLLLWAFGMSYLSHIALDCTTSKRINLL
jgi:hypothetical protein